MAVADSRVTEAKRRLGELKTKRAPREGHWRELMRLTRPLADELFGGGVRGDRSGRASGEIYDMTAGHGATNLAAGLWGMGTNSATEWFSIQAENDDLNADAEVGAWLRRVTQIMLRAFAAGGGNFYAEAMTYFLDLATIGTAVMYSDEDVTAGRLWHATIPLSETYIDQNNRHQVDTLYRAFTFTTRQAAREFGADALHPAMRKALEKDQDRKWQFLHAVEPNDLYDPTRRGSNAMAFQSIYVDLEHDHLVEEGGYQEFAYHVTRWWCQAGEVYGDGPAALARADAKTVNVMAKTTLEGAQAAVRPPLATTDELAARGIQFRPGGVIAGAIDPWSGRELIKPMSTGGAIGLGLDMEEQRRQAIKDAFYWQLLVLQAGDRATATEVLARQEEQLRLMGPHLGRMNAEFLDPVVTRAFLILLRANAFPPAPPSLLASPGLKVTYVSPLARAQKIATAGTILRFLEGALPLAQAKPAALDVIDEDAVMRELAGAYHIPGTLIRDPRQVAALRQSRAEAEQAAQQAAEMQAGAATLRDLGQAAQAAGGAS